MITAYVYQHTNKITGEFYIGYRCANVFKNIPPEIDLPKYICSSPSIKSSIKKNPENWMRQILSCWFDSNDAYESEQKLIHNNWHNPLLLNQQYQLNGTKHFKAPKVFSQKHREKISKGLTGRVRSKEHCSAISNSLMGRTLSLQSIQKRSAKITGQKRTPEQCSNISQSLIGHLTSESTREKISIANSGKQHPKGFDSPCSKPFRCIETNQLFGSQPQAAELLNLKQSDINNVLKGRQKSTKGFHFEFV